MRSEISDLIANFGESYSVTIYFNPGSSDLSYYILDMFKENKDRYPHKYSKHLKRLKEAWVQKHIDSCSFETVYKALYDSLSEVDTIVSNRLGINYSSRCKKADKYMREMYNID